MLRLFFFFFVSTPVANGLSCALFFSDPSVSSLSEDMTELVQATFFLTMVRRLPCFFTLSVEIYSSSAVPLHVSLFPALLCSPPPISEDRHFFFEFKNTPGRLRF